jgi:hypothetical protein
MGMDMLSMAIFWTWNAFQPALQPEPVSVIVPSKVILQANWIEPASLRNEARYVAKRQPATQSQQKFTGKSRTSTDVKKTQPPLWQAAKSWELPPILWASFEGFIAASLGIVSLLKR